MIFIATNNSRTDRQTPSAAQLNDESAIVPKLVLVRHDEGELVVDNPSDIEFLRDLNSTDNNAHTSEQTESADAIAAISSNLVKTINTPVKPEEINDSKLNL